MKRSPLRRRPRKDPVTPDLYLAVLRRDDGCVALRIDPGAGECKGRLTLEHVPLVSRKGVREASSLLTLVVLCRYHAGLWSISGHWNTSHRPELREYLRKMNA